MPKIFSPTTSSALVPNTPIPQPHCRAELCVYHDIVSPKRSNPLQRLLPIGTDSVFPLGQLAFSQLLVLMDSTGLTRMPLLNQSGVALLALLLPPWDFLTSLASLGQDISLAAGRQRIRVLSLDLIFIEAQFIDLCCGFLCPMGLDWHRDCPYAPPGLPWPLSPPTFISVALVLIFAPQIFYKVSDGTVVTACVWFHQQQWVRHGPVLWIWILHSNSMSWTPGTLQKTLGEIILGLHLVFVSHTCLK